MSKVIKNNPKHYAKPVIKKENGKYFRSIDQGNLDEGRTSALIPVPIQGVHNLEAFKRGRPTKYKKRYCDEIIDYFVEAQPMLRVVDDPGGKGGTQTRFETLYIPTVRGFASSIGVSYKTLYEWCDVYSDFRNAFERACSIQDALIEQLALAGRIGKGIGELYFLNRLGYKDSRHLDITSDNKVITPITALQLNVNAPDVNKALPPQQG